MDTTVQNADMEAREFDLTPSLSQKAFWEDPHAFLARLEERATRLFESGYFAYPTDEPHCFSVVHHVKKTSAKDSEYFVRPVEGTCTCPFFARQGTGEYLTRAMGEYLPGAVGENLGEDGEQPYIVPCKHLRGLSLLVRKTRRWLYQTGQIRAFCALAVPWMRMLAHLRRERIRQEHGGHDFSEACTNFIYRGVRERQNGSSKGKHGRLPSPHTTEGFRGEA